MCYCMLWPWSCNTPKVTLIQKQTHTHTHTDTPLLHWNSSGNKTLPQRLNTHRYILEACEHMHTHMHADTDREALYLRDHPLQCASEKSCLSAAQQQTGGLSGGVKDGGTEVWKASKWSWIQRDSNYFSLLVFDTCQGTSVKTLQLAEQNDIERERESQCLGIDW